MLSPHVIGLFDELDELGDRDINRDINIEKLKKFVLSRRASDGGFAFCKPLPSSLPETYYAVYVLRAIDVEISDREKLVDFLYGSIREEVYAIFYTFRCLKMLDEKLPDLSEFLLERLDEVLKRFPNLSQGMQTVDYNMGTMDNMDNMGTMATYSFNLPSILREVCLITCSLKLLGKDLPDDVRSFAEKLRKGGGFGVSSPNLQETYYCLQILNGKADGDIVSFIRQHECPSGGFTKSPGGYPPYLEETYYALSCLKLLGFRYPGPELHRLDRILKYIASLQNANGGFRRSIYGGISTLEDTYYAIASLIILKDMKMEENLEENRNEI